MDASDIRKQMLTIRNAMSINEVEQYSAVIDEKLYSYIDEHPTIRSILCFYPKGNEVALLPLYEKLNGMYRLYFPVTLGSDISFYQANIDDHTDFRPGSFDIMEPVNRTKCFPLDDDETDNTIAIVPGLCFSGMMKGRIGYGKGYYDRFLKKYDNIYKIGVCYDFQIDEEIIQSENDIPMDMIITNTESYE